VLGLIGLRSDRTRSDNDDIRVCIALSRSLAVYVIVCDGHLVFVCNAWGLGRNLKTRRDFFNLGRGRQRRDKFSLVLLASWRYPKDAFCIVAAAPGSSSLASRDTHSTMTKELCQTEFFHAILDGGQFLLNGSW
jgi:hypothetical protein